MASTEVTWARSGMRLVLVQIFFDALGFAQEIGRVLVGSLDKFFERLHGLLEFVGELHLFLILPGVAQRGEAGLEGGHAVLEVGVEFFQFGREFPDLFGVHDGLWHRVISLYVSEPAGRRKARNWFVISFATICPVFWRMQRGKIERCQKN